MAGDISYIPGALTAVVGDQCVALVETAPDSPAVTRIWQQLGQGAAAAALLAGLVADGLDGLAGFTLLVALPGGQHRLFCRGTVGATVVRGVADSGSAPGAVPGAAPGTPERIDGAGLLTWREQVVDGADRIFLGEPPADTALRLPATSGVLLAGCVIIDLTNAASRDTVADEPGRAKKSIVFFPETLTMTHPASLAGSWSDPAWAGGGQRPGAPLSGPMVPPAPVTGPMPARPQNPQHPRNLIDAPPWLSGPGGPAPTAKVPAEPRYPQSAEPGPFDSGSGFTVKRGEGPDLATMTVPPDRIGPVVPALICPTGHVNPPSGATCRRCGAPLPHDPVPVPRPVLGVLRMSFGDVITLDRGVLMGRNPRTDFAGPDGFGGAGGEERPHVVKLPSAGGDISRTHLRVTLDGWHVLVTDLNSTNGTLITLPGRDPQQVRPGEPVPIQPGTVVTLAEGIEFRYEVSE